MARFITGLDIGTAAVKSAVAEVGKDGEVKLTAISRHPSLGVRKGVISYIDDVQNSASSALEKVKGVSKLAAKNVYLNVGGGNTNMRSSRGMVVVSRADSEIYQDDIDRVVKSSQDAVRARNREVLHTVTREFFVDGMPNIEEPMGMVGNKLEVESFIIDAWSHEIRNLNKAVEKSGAGVTGMFFNPLSASRAVLTKNQKDLGVAMVDIGAGTTSLAVFEEGKLLHAAVLPIGSVNITNDLAIGLKVPVEAAEALKLSAGYAISKDIPIKEKLDLKKVDPKSKQPVSRRFFSEIIEVRLAEIFELVNNELKNIERQKDLPAGVVLSGGGSKMPGIVELAKRELKLPVQLGLVTGATIAPINQEIEEKMEDPEYANSIGLVLSGLDHMQENRTSSFNPLSKFLNYFLP